MTHYKRPPFTFQNVTFRSVKAPLLLTKSIAFTMQNLTFSKCLIISWLLISLFGWRVETSFNCCKELSLLLLRYRITDYSFLSTTICWHCILCHAFLYVPLIIKQYSVFLYPFFICTAHYKTVFCNIVTHFLKKYIREIFPSCPEKFMSNNQWRTYLNEE